MKAKDKARGLMQKAYDLDQHNKTPQSKCKEIALLCVDEILNAPQIGSGWLHKYEPYWTQVKQEINKL